MKWFVLVVCCVQLAISLPQGYNYKDSGPVSSSLGGFRPVVGAVAPCNHGHNAAALVQQQSIGRIIHQGSGHGGGQESQAVTVNSHITVGEGDHSHTQLFKEGQGYVDEGRPAPIPLQQGPPLPLPGPAPPFLSQSFGSSHNSFGSSGSFNHAGHGSGSVVNGIGRVPAPTGPGLSGGYQQHGGSFGGSSGFGSSGFGNSRPTFSGAQVNPNFIVGDSRPIGGVSHHHQGSGSSYQNAGGFSGGAQFHGGSGGFSQQQSGGFSHGSGSQSFGQSGNFGSASSSSAVLNGALGNVIRETFATAPLDPTIEKHIYVHVPPEDLEEKESHQQARFQEGAAKKHYKIIFIKAPTVSQPAANYAQLANAAGVSEEKTIVYVLVKKPEEPSLHEIQQLQQSISKPSKPEVYFIKYKTRNEQQGGGGGGGGGFIGGSYNSNIEHSSGGHHIESIGGNQFAGSEVDGGIDVRVNGSGSGIESTQEGGAILSSGSSSSSSSSSSSYSTSSSNVNIGETSQPHEVYGIPSVPSV